MATEININTLVDRMEKIVQYNESLFDRNKQGLKDDTIFKKIIKGTPKDLPSVYPCLMLVPGNPLRDPSYMGTTAYYNKIRIVARILVSNDDAEVMQKAMLDIEALIRQAFEENRKMTDPADVNDTTGLVKHIIGEKSIPLAGLYIKSTGAIVDGLEIPFLMEQSSG